MYRKYKMYSASALIIILLKVIFDVDKVSKIRNIYIYSLSILYSYLYNSILTILDSTHFKTIMSLERQSSHPLRKCPKFSISTKWDLHWDLPQMTLWLLISKSALHKIKCSMYGCFNKITLIKGLQMLAD